MGLLCCQLLVFYKGWNEMASRAELSCKGQRELMFQVISPSYGEDVDVENDSH
ncbi:hypothetical protein Cul210932_2280 [Corynebacterium ulcerans]|nr:hypothetical protein Cul210932_2280 [Corynebacterium ulcerans]